MDFKISKIIGKSHPASNLTEPNPSALPPRIGGFSFMEISNGLIDLSQPNPYAVPNLSVPTLCACFRFTVFPASETSPFL